MGVKILSLYDGMACGMIAMQLAGVEVESYDAYEIDKYAIKTAQHNFPMIKEHGDVFDADFTQYEGVDFLVGGSPCTYWSIAQTKNRETVASGMGWELFSQYVRALHEAKPKYFIYENNKSMSKQIRASIDDAFGFEAVLINSALVSAQNRQRLYWVGKRNEDGTYSQVPVEQPKDRGILLWDILETGVCWRDKSYTLDANYYKTAGTYNPKKQHSCSRLMAAEPMITTPDGKSFCILTSVEKDNRVAEPINDIRCANGGGAGAKTGLYAVPVQYEELAEEYCKGCVDGSLVGMIKNASVCRNGKQPSQQYRVYSCEAKSVCVDTDQRKHYLIPYDIEFDTDGNPVKAIGQGGKEITIYEVKDGKITIKGKQYPIKLRDGYYIIRKLTISECKRLQTVPEWYEFPVSNSQAYKMLGNGWTCEVICHLINSCFKSTDVLPGQIGLWGGVDG